MINWYQRQKLIHQIGLIICVGFAVSFFLSLYLLSSEKSKSLTFLSSSGGIQRVISVVNILSQTPAELHHSIIQASSSSDLSLSITREPNIETNQDNNPEVAQLIERLRTAGINRVHLSLVQQARPILNMSEMHNTMMSGRPMRKMLYLATIDGSIRLSSGSWLNFSSGVREEITHWSTSVLILLSAAMLLTILISLFIIQKALAPVRALGKAAGEFAMNKKVSLVKTDGPQDLYPTIKAFNEMQLQLSDYIQQRSKLLAAISHDLRTPMTSLRLRLEFIEESDDKLQMQRTLSIMEKMLQATMRFAKDDNQIEERQSTDVNSLMQTIVDEYSEKNITVQYQGKEKLIENIPPLSTRRMVENLINNSIQYGGELNSISLNMAIDKKYLVIAVIDTGIGIDDSKLEEVVKPFTRLNTARDTDDSNVGLGLSITKSLANAYGGQLILEKNTPQGLIAKITISLGE
ncbi:MAG TPA: ATP-binding protein [Psychromonas sp.]